MSSIWVTTLWMYGLAIAVSMGVAVIIKLIVVALGALEDRRVAASAAPAAAPTVAPAAEGIPHEHIAAITAAIFEAMGAHRVLQIVDLHRHEGWVAEGRGAQHRSHTIDHHPRR